MIARNDEHRHAEIGDAAQRLIRLIRERRQHGRPIEHVAGVHDEIDFAGERWRERGGVVGEKIIAATPPADARAHGQIEAEMRVGEEEDSDVVGHPLYLLAPGAAPTISDFRCRFRAPTLRLGRLFGLRLITRRL